MGNALAVFPDASGVDAGTMQRIARELNLSETTFIGMDVALAYHRRFSNGNEVFVNYGTPAASATVLQVIVKYVLHTGGAAGT